MKKKVAFWVVVILANVVIGTISVRTYQNIDTRITSLETQGVDGKYDFNSNLIKSRNLNKFFEYKAYARTSVVLEISGKLTGLFPDLPEKSTQIREVPAIVIGPRYVLMASHVSDAEIIRQQMARTMTPFGALEQIFEFKVLEYNVTLLLADGSERSLKELYRNKEKDFALFKLAENVSPDGAVRVSAPNFPFEIGKSSELQIGHFIYINGRPGIDSIDSEVARPGFVTSLVSAVSNEALGVKKSTDGFGLSQSTDQGDSGSPIVAFRDGQPELIGIYLGWFGTAGDNGKNTRSRALKINVAVDEIKEKLGIDLRETQRGILSP